MTRTALTAPSDASALMSIIGKAAADPTIDVVKLQALLAVKREWEADEARKEYNRAFAEFKAEATRIVKNKVITDGPLKGRRYADLFAVVETVSQVLSKFGLSSSWSITKDDKDWIEVSCILTHVAGHSEVRSMGGPPDAGGAKNAIQARASTVSYLERYTFLAVTGMASADQDDDGRGGGEAPQVDPWTPELKAAATAAVTAGTYGKWWAAQTAKFRGAAIKTQTHIDFKTPPKAVDEFVREMNAAENAAEAAVK